MNEYAPESTQLYLPLNIRPAQEVSWMVAEEVRDWRKLGRKAVMVLAGSPQFVSIDVEKINELKDLQLRYALRFAAAADSMGAIRDSEYSSHGQEVRITATDEGVDSRLLNQWYSGMDSHRTDTFMADLCRFAPDQDENH